MLCGNHLNLCLVGSNSTSFGSASSHEEMEAIWSLVVVVSMLILGFLLVLSAMNVSTSFC